MAKTKKPLTAEDRLRALYDLQLIDSRIDRIRVVRGELPLEVEDVCEPGTPTINGTFIPNKKKILFLNF